MNDEEIEAKVSLFIDGELEPNEHAIVQLKIDTDEVWKAHFERLRKTSVVMKGFFRTETSSAGASTEVRDEAVKRIVVESTMLLRRKRSLSGSFARTWKKNKLFILLALFGVLALGVALRESLLGGSGADARELLNAAAPALDRKNAEIKLDFTKAEGMILGPLFASGTVPTTCTIETDAAGRFHLRFPGNDGATSHFGYDGKTYWMWQSNAANVFSFPDDARDEVRVARAIRDVWKRMDESIRRAASAAEDAKIAGHEVVREGAGEWTKIDATMKGILAGRGRLWLDDQKRVRRVMVHGIVVNIAGRTFAPEDFSPSAWAPGATIQELK